jgi:cytochrome c-type biogenesis protein CcsB
MKVDERMNICLMMFEGSFLKIFPEQSSNEDVWISPSDTGAFIPLTGPVNIIKRELNLEVLSYNSLMHSYFNDLLKAIKTGDYSKPDKILGFFEAIQRNSASSELLPSGSKIKLEVRYNNSRIFTKLKNVYGILSIILLILAFIENLGSGKNKLLRSALYFFILLLGLAFLYHTYGLGLRWYLSGHAPWSNGYEALLLIAWGGLLAGFIYLRYSRITLASTALLGFLILMTAGHSSYDPQITNLQPVLKSYWLIIHVAVMTISYGFLGSGFILGIINLMMYLFKTPLNKLKLSRTSEELTNINEMNLTIGLVLATLGTFLGAIWANESWGRYWGWDAKETWALVIIITYAIILHFRLVPKLKSEFIFNAASVVGFGSVIMTFVGVNYYLSKGLHSYASGETPVFPVWAWVIIISIFILVVAGGIKENIKQKSERGNIK